MTGTPAMQSVVSATLLALGGAALVVSAFLRWTGSGLGSALSLRELGDLLLSDRFGVVNRWFGAVAYVVPVCGGLAIVSSGLPRRTARGAVVVLAVVVAVFVVAGLGLVGDRSLGPGWWTAACGLVLLVAGAVATRP